MKKLSFILLFSMTTIMLFGQKRGEKSEKIEAYRVAFFTQKLDLTADESKAFWPVYNDYQKELRELRKAERQLNRGNYGEMSDQELEEAIEKRFELRQKQLDLEKQYYKKFKAVLPMKKLAKLPRTERAFRSELLKKVKEQRERGN
jgi:hypothetical protein